MARHSRRRRSLGPRLLPGRTEVRLLWRLPCALLSPLWLAGILRFFFNSTKKKGDKIILNYFSTITVTRRSLCSLILKKMNINFCLASKIPRPDLLRQSPPLHPSGGTL